MWLLHAHAEGLPNKVKFSQLDASKVEISTATSSSSARVLEKEDEDNDGFADADLGTAQVVNSSDEERALRGTAMFMSQQRGIDDIVRAGLQGTVPRRYLHPGSPIHLWWQYCAVEVDSGRKPGCYSVFMEAVNFMFRKTRVLGFRKSSGDHAKCTACDGYKTELKRASFIAQRAEIMQATIEAMETRENPSDDTITSTCGAEASFW